MAKFGGNLGPLYDFKEPFSLKPGGRIFNLSSSLVMQQSTLDATTTTDGESFTIAGGAGNSSFTAAFSSSLNCLTASDPSNTEIALPGRVSSFLSFASKELTVSLWVSGNTISPTIPSTSSSFLLQTSGSYGLQFNLSRFDPSGMGDETTFVLNVMTGNCNYGEVHHVASTTKTVGLSAAEIPVSPGTGLEYRGRYFPLSRPPASLLTQNFVRAGEWHHIVYVQKAAENPKQGTYRKTLDVTTSPLLNTSETGKEGLCQMWLNGELVYQTPAWGPFPSGHSPFFYEDGLFALGGNGDTARFLTAFLQNKTILQNGTQTIMSGSSANGDAFAQVSIWNRVLRPDEIGAIYDGTKSGIYTQNLTSYSSAPKRLIDLVDRVSTPFFANSGFYDSSSTKKLGAFRDSDSSTELSTDNVYQGNNYFSLEGNRIGFSDGVLIEDYSNVSSFSDKDEVTEPVKDDEYVIPSGSAAIRIPLLNEDGNTIAGRYHYPSGAPYSTVMGLTDDADFIGTGFLYYSPKLKKWIEKRYRAETSLTSDTATTKLSTSASNFISIDGGGYFINDPQIDAFASGNNKIMAQFSWSPQFGYFVKHVEHLQQAGYERIGWPTSMFGAPNAPRYHGFDHETIKLRDYITQPFVLKRIELRIPVRAQRRFGDNPPAPSPPPGPPGPWPPPVPDRNLQVTNKKDLDNYVFFVYRQRRVSRDVDQESDWNTSKRYLLASASVCYYNLASYGGAWQDDFYNDVGVTPGFRSKWQSLSSTPGYISGGLYDGLAQPTATVDFFNQSLTQITSENLMLHNPAYSKNWDIGRFSAADLRVSDDQFLNIAMFPAVVPECQVSPSLIPITASVSVDFSYREAGLYGGCHVNSGSYFYVTTATPAAAVTLISNRWLGGSRPPPIAASSANDPYRSIEADDEGFITGSIDAKVQLLPTYAVTVCSPPFAYDGLLSTITWRTQRGTAQQYGFTYFPTDLLNAQKGVSSLVQPRLIYQPFVNPQSVNSGIPIGGTKSISWYGRYTSPSVADEWSVYHGGKYMGYYGWRFISPYQLSSFEEKQLYSPEILMPDDELILGLDAGTFGPPDVDTDDLPGDGLSDGPTAGQARGGGLESPGNNRVFKNSHLKDEYYRTLADSGLRIRRGEAELILIGDFVSNDRVTLPQRSSPQQDKVSSFYGDEMVVDQSFLFSGELLSGSAYTRVFTGSEGPKGLVDGNTNPDAARRFYRDAGVRRS